MGLVFVREEAGACVCFCVCACIFVLVLLGVAWDGAVIRWECLKEEL